MRNINGMLGSFLLGATACLTPSSARSVDANPQPIQKDSIEFLFQALPDPRPKLRRQVKAFDPLKTIKDIFLQVDPNFGHHPSKPPNPKEAA